MSETDTEQSTTLNQMKPYLLASVAVLIIILALFFLWPSSKTDQPVLVTDVPTEGTNVPEQVTEPVYDDVQPDVFQPAPEPVSVVLDSTQEESSLALEGDIEPDPIIDESDGAVKKALMDIATSPTFASLLVNESLLQKFVINVYNMANSEAAPNHSLLTPPEQSFKIYQQADREWIDPSSFQRYNTYVDVLESMPPENLVGLISTYKDTLEEKHAEIAPRNSSFTRTLARAIDELLDTPAAPVPIEVYSDSVMYKFKDPQLEALSAPQKQLLRTGPENMRRIKQVLRELKQEIEDTL